MRETSLWPSVPAAPSRATGVRGPAPPLSALLAVGCLLFCRGVTCPADWPEWRGPGRSGHWRDVELPAKLTDAALEKVWEVEVGGGYSGVAVAGNRVLALDRPGKESQERLHCLDRATGKILWTHATPAAYGDMDYASGPRSTPTVADGKVYTQGAVGHVLALQLEGGKLLWQLDVHAELGGAPPEWGHAASPLVTRGMVIVQGPGAPGPTLIALDAATGKERWRALADKPGYSSPVLGQVLGREELLHWSAESAAGLNPATGEVRWRTPYKSTYAVAIISPVLEDGLLLVSGYWEGSKAVRLDGRREPEVVWSGKELSCLMSTPLFRAGHLYALDRNSGVLGVEWKTGKVLWSDRHRTTPRDRNPQASMVWAGERAVILNALGELLLTELSPSGLTEHGRVKLCKETWSHPAFSNQEIFARAEKQLVCWRVKTARG